MPSTLGNFTDQAGAYHHGRPSYPPALLHQLIAHCGLHAGDPVADLGAGTGLFTALLAEHRLRITAIEPNRAMRDAAPPLPGVAWTPGSFDATGLPTASQRWAVAAQAFHWADPITALPEIARILQPGARFTALWNNRRYDLNPIVLQKSLDLVLEACPDYNQPYRDKDWPAVLTSTGHFTDVAYHEATHIHTLDRASYLQLWRSINRLRSALARDAFESLLQRIARQLDAENITAIAIPYTCKAWTARRSPLQRA